MGCGLPELLNLADNVPHLAHLWAHDVSFVRISRAPIEKLLAYAERMGWQVPWVSSWGCSYNQDSAGPSPTVRSPE